MNSLKSAGAAVTLFLTMKAWLRTRKRAVVWCGVVAVLAGIIGTGWSIDRDWPSPNGTMTVRTSEPFLALLFPANQNKSRAVLISRMQVAKPQVVFEASAFLLDEGFPEINGVLWKSNDQGFLVVHHGFIVNYVTACTLNGPNLKVQPVQEKKWIDAVINENLKSSDPEKRIIAGKIAGGYSDWTLAPGANMGDLTPGPSPS